MRAATNTDWTKPVTPTPDDSRRAGEAVHRLKGRAGRLFLSANSGSRDRSKEGPVQLPAPAFRLLVRLLEHLAAGDGVRLIPADAELTTGEAAEVLGVSRPFVVKQMDEGLLPCRKVGKHRRVTMKELVAYKQSMDSGRRAALRELAAEGQRLGLDL